MLTAAQAKKKYIKQSNDLEKKYGDMVETLEAKLERIQCNYDMEIGDIEAELEEKQEDVYETYMAHLDVIEKVREKKAAKKKGKK